MGATDVGALRRLLDVFADAFEDPEGYLGDPPSSAYLERLLGDTSFVALVAVEEQQVVGGLTAYELRKPERERSEIYLYDLAVAPAFRRAGVATALIEQLGCVAKERGAWVVFVQADQGDEPAIALYSKLGVREDVHHFDIYP